MEKNYTLLLLLFCNIGLAQVGIGTENPEAELDVRGSLLVQEAFKIGSLVTVKNSDVDFKLLTRLTNSSPVGELTVLDVDSLTVAPINVVNYTFTNINKGNLKNVDLGYDADKYIVGVANFQYLGQAVEKKPVGTTSSIGAFVIRSFIENNTWHLEIRNRFLELATGGGSSNMEYRATLIIYNKSYFRNLPVIETNLNGSNSGTASSVPNL